MPSGAEASFFIPLFMLSGASFSFPFVMLSEVEASSGKQEYLSCPPVLGGRV